MKKIILNPIYFIFIIFLLIKGYFLLFLNYFIALIFHEYSHFYVADKLGYKLQKMYISPVGVCLNYSDEFFAEDDEFKIAIAGPLANIILAICTIALWWLKPTLYYFTYHFCFANLTIALFNVLPCYPLDGGRVLVNFVAKSKTREFALKITEIINYVVAAILFAVFVLSLFTTPNITFLLLSVFLLVGAIKPKNKIAYNNLKTLKNKSKILNKGTSIKFIAVADTMPLYKIKSKFSRFKFNVVYVVSDTKSKVYTENAISALMLKYGATVSVRQILSIK